MVSENPQDEILWLKGHHAHDWWVSLPAGVVLSTCVQFFKKNGFVTLRSLRWTTNLSNVPASNFSSSVNLWPSKSFFKLLTNILYIEHWFISGRRVPRWQQFRATYPSKTPENVGAKNLRDYPWESSRTIHQILHSWNQLQRCCEVCSPTSVIQTKAAASWCVPSVSWECYWHATCSVLAWPSTLWLHLVPKTQMESQAVFDGLREKDSCSGSEARGSLCTFPMGFIRKGWWPNLNNLSLCFFKTNFGSFRYHLIQSSTSNHMDG